jgi:hypothetical protein
MRTLKLLGNRQRFEANKGGLEMTPWGSKEVNAQKNADKVIKNFKTTVYSEGFLNGVRYARNQVIEFLEAHYSLGDILTGEEIIKELQYWKIQDNHLKGLADGIMAPIYGLGKSEDVCEDCFGADLCLVCERASQ